MSYSAPRPPRHWHAIGTINEWYQRAALPTSSATYPTADLAIYAPVRVFDRVTIRKLYAVNGTAVSGNIDIGVYDAGGTRLVSTGRVAQAGTVADQTIDVTDTVIGPGIYYVAVVLDNTTGTLHRTSPAAPAPTAHGFLTQQLGAAAALPASATFALLHTLTYIPNIGMLIEATVA